MKLKNLQITLLMKMIFNYRLGRTLNYSGMFNPIKDSLFLVMSYASSKGALNNCIRRVRLVKPQIGSMEALIFSETLLKTFALQMNVTSSKSSVFVVGLQKLMT